MFGCLADKAYANDDHDNCLINDSNACNFGIAVGVIGMLMCLGMFTKDIVYIIVKQNRVSTDCIDILYSMGKNIYRPDTKLSKFFLSIVSNSIVNVHGLRSCL